jgi:hypothetical protein
MKTSVTCEERKEANIAKGITSMVVVLPNTNDMCITRKPIILNANDKFKTEIIKA